MRLTPSPHIWKIPRFFFNELFPKELLVKFLSYDESYSEGWEPKILNGISLGTKRYDRILKLRHNEVKLNILDTFLYGPLKRNTSTGLQNEFFILLTTGNKLLFKIMLL